MPEQTPPIVEFRAVEKRFGDGPLVLDRIDLVAQPEDFIGIIGPSGCGKTTILRLLAGLSPVTSGKLTIAGLPPQDAAHELAFVFQDATLLPWLTVEENVQLLLRLRGLPTAYQQAMGERVLRQVHLIGKHHSYPRQLSGGQRMRVSLARALSLTPKIILLDEPFGALDEITREHLNEELLEARTQQTWTAFFVTHSVAEAIFLSNRILVMSANPGRIHQEIRVDLPYPRTAETRESTEYLHLVGEVSHLLRSVEHYQP